MNEKLKNNIFLWITPIIWGVAFVTQRIGGDYLGAFTYNAIRFGIGTLSLIPVILIFEKGDFSKECRRLTWLGGMLGGLFLFAGSSLQQVAITITESAGKAGFLTALYTVLVPVIAVFLGKKNTFFTWIGVALATVGMYLLSFKGEEPFGVGDMLLLLCALMFALQIIAVDRFNGRIAPLRFSMIQLATSAVLSTIVALFTESCTMTDIRSALVALLYGGIMSCGVGYTTQILGQRGASETYSAIVLSTESVFSAISGALILHETMNTKGYIGCALIFAGIVIAHIMPKKVKTGATK